MRTLIKVTIVAGLAIALLIFYLPLIRGVGVPREQKLVVCTNALLQFQMNCLYSPPYAFVLGVPLLETNMQPFHGELAIRQKGAEICRVPIGSQELTPCNWLHEPATAGYILTWSHATNAQRFSDFLRVGQTYEVQVAFEEPPPRQSSLWLSSLEKVHW